MAGTLTDMIARIASEINRPDLSAVQIPTAITTAIAAYQSERFSFSDVPPDGSADVLDGGKSRLLYIG